MVLYGVPARLRGSGRPGLAVALAGLGLILLLVALLATRLRLLPWGSAATPDRPAAVHFISPRPQVTYFAAALGHVGVLRGTLEPTLPGLNIVRVVLQRPVGASAAGQLTLVATMPGMGMPPVRATLRARGNGYSGALALPMFGRYHVAVTVERAGRTVRGAVTLTLPLGQERGIIVATAGPTHRR
ncbi:MAG: hypothetical protein NVSMB65_05060 [Chloroflexota bacterium]